MVHRKHRLHCLRKNWNFLQLLSRSNPRQRRFLIQTASPGEIDCISETCHNILKGTIPLSRYYKNQLQPFKEDICVIGCPRNSVRTRQRFLTKQSGGNLLAVLSPILLKKILPAAGKALAVHLLGKVGSKLSNRIFPSSKTEKK